MKNNHSTFRGRALIAVLVSACFILLVPSGAILFLSHNTGTPRKSRAPIVHAELLALRELAQHAGVPVETAVQRLRFHKLVGVSPEIQVGKLAKQNRLAPAQLFSLLKGQSAVALPQDSSSDKAGDQSANAVGNPSNLNVDAALARFKARGISVEPGTSLSEVVSKYSQPESSR